MQSRVAAYVFPPAAALRAATFSTTIAHTEPELPSYDDQYCYCAGDFDISIGIPRDSNLITAIMELWRLDAGIVLVGLHAPVCLRGRAIRPNLDLEMVLNASYAVGLLLGYACLGDYK